MGECERKKTSPFVLVSFQRILSCTYRFVIHGVTIGVQILERDKGKKMKDSIDTFFSICSGHQRRKPSAKIKPVFPKLRRVTRQVDKAIMCQTEND